MMEDTCSSCGEENAEEEVERREEARQAQKQPPPEKEKKKNAVRFLKIHRHNSFFSVDISVES